MYIYLYIHVCCYFKEFWNKVFLGKVNKYLLIFFLYPCLIPRLTCLSRSRRFPDEPWWFLRRPNPPPTPPGGLAVGICAHTRRSGTQAPLPGPLLFFLLPLPSPRQGYRCYTISVMFVIWLFSYSILLVCNSLFTFLCDLSCYLKCHLLINILFVYTCIYFYLVAISIVLFSVIEQ